MQVWFEGHMRGSWHVAAMVTMTYAALCHSRKPACSGSYPSLRGDHGHPFIGPASRLLDDALEAAGIHRRLAYVPNTVKALQVGGTWPAPHPPAPERARGRGLPPWLDGELDALRPQVLVCLGATAARALFGSSFQVTKQRGEVLTATKLAPAVMATVHPPSVLRARAGDERREQCAALVADLRMVAALLATAG